MSFINTLSIIVNIIIICITTWAVLSPKVKTGSFVILGIGLMNIASAVGIDEILRNIHVNQSVLLMRCGVALLAIVYFYGVEIRPLLLSTARRH